jgi:hypothetical protein
MEYRDPVRESKIQLERQTKVDNKLKSVEELRSTSFNLVSHEGPPRKYDLLLKQRNEEFHTYKHLPRNYHMLTNLPHTVHAKTATQYNEETSLAQYKETFKNSRLNQHYNRIKANPKDREYNIVSNDFYENPEERKHQEYEKLRNHVLKKWKESHNYDPIKGVYYSPGREDIYQEQKKVLNEIYGKSKDLGIPPSIVYAEGQSYNVINHEPYDETKLTVSMTSLNRSLNRMNKTSKEMKIIEENEIKKEKQDSLHANRVSFKRWETELNRGYNPIKNEVVTAPYLPVPSSPSTMWERLSSLSPSASLSASSLVLGGNIQDQNNNRRAATSMKNSRVIDQFPMNNSEASYGKQLPPLSGAGGGVGTARDEEGRTSRVNTTRDRGAVVPPTNRAQTAVGTEKINSRGNETGMKPMTSSSSVPKLDLSKTDYGEPVAYKEPTAGPPGLAIPMVRTGGGLSQYSH